MQLYANIDDLEKKVVSCRLCPRLVSYRETCLLNDKKYEGVEFWRKPVPGHGDINGKMLIVGLAPAASGGNRTGRVFTGYKSSDFLFSCLYSLKLSNKPLSVSRDDGLVYNGMFITAAVKCVPPENKPTNEEINNCSRYLDNEVRLMKNLRSIVCLGKIAFEAVDRLYRSQSSSKNKNEFKNGKFYSYGKIRAYCLYHPSPRNVNTGKITKEEFTEIIRKAKRYANLDS